MRMMAEHRFSIHNRQCRFTTLFVMIISMITIPVVSFADNHITVQKISVECTTKATGFDGVRHSCMSEPSVLTAPKGHVFVENSLEVKEISGAGSLRKEERCIEKLSDYVEIIPDTGIKQPTRLELKAKARGPKGHGSGRGWAKCRVTINLVRLSMD